MLFVKSVAALSEPEACVGYINETFSIAKQTNECKFYDTLRIGFNMYSINSYLECVPVAVADNDTIPDSALKASTFYNTYYHPYHGRLNETRGRGAWCPQTKSDRTDYLQVDMGTELSVCAVATQGALIIGEWTTSYKLDLSADGVTWETYKESNVEKVCKCQ